MNFRDALLSDQSPDRMPVEMDRRLRQRLGLEAPAVARRLWLRPAIAGFAVAAIALAVIFYPAKQHDAVVTHEAAIVAAPGTQVVRTSARTVLLTHGSIEVHREDATPMFVDVPMGRVVIASYHSTVTVDPERVTILISDGSGHYDDANGQSHPLVPNAPLVWPPAPSSTSKPAMPAPKPSVPALTPRPHGKAIAPAPATEQPIQEAPPGETPPSSPSPPPHADRPCTFKSDCDEGQTCRQNERKESVCMGNGGEGAACWFDNDCVSQHCAGRRCASL